ncbi:unnamed protein product [Mytilus coruscus]|uniref:Uncharacterized protein n=1 Tax=Mytilus coruscus TaxID=42192 RepID=A0A6J8ACU8_MYTCO|nr:unnamed protein product [Mytilus coruscus]
MTILFVFLSICFLTCCFAEDNHKHTGHNESRPYGTIFSVGLLIPNCKVQPVDPELRSKLNIMLSEGTKLIFIHLEFEDHKNLESKSHQGDTYKPLDWIRTYGRHGRSLLHLRPQFERLSLTTLSFNIEHIDVRLKQTPTRCLTRHNVSTIEDNLRRLLVMEFKMNLEDDHAVENEKICNVEVKNEQSIVAFKYVCCWHGHSKVNEHLECKNISSDYWMEILFTCIFLIKILVLMFCPLLIPASLYRKKYTETVYEHVLSKPIELRIKKIIKDDKSKLAYLNVPSVEMNQLKNMQDSYEWNRVCKLKKFYETMKTVPINKVLTISLRKLDIVVRYDRLFRQIMYQLAFYKSSIFGFQWLFGKKAQTLNIDKETDKVTDDEMQTSTIQPEDIIKYPWHRCLRQTMRLLLILAISVPWALRVYFYYEYEDSEASNQKKAAEVRNLTLPAFKWSLTYTLTPLHPLFILFYAVIITDAIVFALVEAIASECFEEQKNTAFQITANDDGKCNEQTNENDANVRLIVSKDGIPKWSVRKLILFLDRQDQPYLTEKFFFSTCYMDTVGAPGPLIPNVIHAMKTEIENDNIGDSHSVTARLIDKVNDAVMTTLENESAILLGEPPKQSIGFYKDIDDRGIDFLVIEKPSKVSNV